MATLRAVSFPSIHLPTISATPPFEKSMLFNPPDRQLTSLSLSSCRSKPKIKLLSTISSTVSTEPIDPPTPEAESSGEKEKFDWYSQWYPVAPVCDLDKRVPHAKRVMGLDVVVWWDRNEGKWQVFDDSCPHRLAPLSEGRIDQWGRLQCVYHGWCFDGAGNCKFIPQAPPDGAPVYSFKKACAAVYPSIVQNNIVWFWPSTEPRYKDIMMKQKPPYIPELDDPSYSRLMGNRDIPYGYEVLIENLMDPAHVPYAHYKIMRVPRPKSRVKADREGGRPMEINVQTLDINGFVAKQENGHSKFIPPCIFFASPDLIPDQGNGSASSGSVKKSQRRFLLIFICIPVSPGKSRLIWTFPRNFAVWIDRVVPRWMFHIGQNLILDSDLYLLHLEERKIHEIGPSNWQKACFVPTKSDALVIAFRKWLRKYSGGQIDWAAKFDGALPPTPPREQLMDRYWSHVVNCSSCRVAIKGLKVLEVVLQVISVALIGIVAAIKQNMVSTIAKTTVVSVAVLCFAASRWLSHFIYKNFYFHDYNHAFV
ncbi:PREDICTED: protochlorophyllide-dependent translocon component 52, chloroplastic isoform X2 [Nelumbo nucifera]|uniref:Protochlorophyllide-dependent translocon component 52, chloroplastic isoform X2 n=1 Tax=Nelumbo nucifera TaxID=4432 RepID=A0A1U7ZVC8_NELNU|nr:PREDICTED: protochlorophyllide-dependent translocon component 52, chloroplastic isoform X2 [Nelumbo nucifera]